MKYILGLVLVMSLAACGGGGGGGSLPTTTPVSTPATPSGGSPPPSGTPSSSPSPTANPSSNPTISPTSSPTASPSPAALQITANVPLNDSQNFLQSPLVFGVRLLSVNGAVANAVKTQTATCTTSSCHVGLTAPVGADTFAITYAVLSPTQSNPNNLAPVAYAGPFSVSVAQNTTNTATVNLLGVPASYELDATGNSPWSTKMPLALNVVDASNSCVPQQVSANNCTVSMFVPGVFSNPITLRDTDTSGQTALVLNNGTPAAAVTVTKASDMVALLMNSGANITQAYVTPSGAFNAAQFGNSYASMTLQPWYTQDPNGLGFTCTKGSCTTTGPSSITIQSRRRHS